MRPQRPLRRQHRDRCERVRGSMKPRAHSTCFRARQQDVLWLEVCSATAVSDRKPRAAQTRVNDIALPQEMQRGDELESNLAYVWLRRDVE
jgi:hypothetical protein